MFASGFGWQTSRHEKRVYINFLVFCSYNDLR
jgi:hypothetical protein